MQSKITPPTNGEIIVINPDGARQINKPALKIVK